MLQPAQAPNVGALQLLGLACSPSAVVAPRAAPAGPASARSSKKRSAASERLRLGCNSHQAASHFCSSGALAPNKGSLCAIALRVVPA